MSDIVPLDSLAGAVSREHRRSARSIVRRRVAFQARMAHIADEADAAIEKIEQASIATANAMLTVARVNGVQKQLEQQSPELSGRLARLADYHELAVAQCVEDLRRDLRRR